MVFVSRRGAGLGILTKNTLNSADKDFFGYKIFPFYFNVWEILAKEGGGNHFAGNVQRRCRLAGPGQLRSRIYQHHLFAGV